MVLADALCAMNLAASVMVNGVCCCYQMHEQNERRKEQESILRSAIRSEWNQQWDKELELYEMRTKSRDEASVYNHNGEEQQQEQQEQQQQRPSHPESKEEILKRKRNELAKQYQESFSSQLEAQRQQILEAQKQFEIYSKASQDTPTTNTINNNNEDRRVPPSPSPSPPRPMVRTISVPTKTGGGAATGKFGKRSSCDPRLKGISFVAATPSGSSTSSPELFVLSDSPRSSTFVNQYHRQYKEASARSIRAISSLFDDTDDEEEDEESLRPASSHSRIGADEGSLEEIYIE